MVTQLKRGIFGTYHLSHSRQLGDCSLALDLLDHRHVAPSHVLKPGKGAMWLALMTQHNNWWQEGG